MLIRWNVGILFSYYGDGQVIGPFLITLRVANQRALTSEPVVSGHLGSLHFRSRAKSAGGGTLPDGYPLGSMDSNRETPGELGSEMTIDFRVDETL